MAGPPVYVSTVYAAPMSCPASAGAAETANGAVERMVLLGLTGVYYIISAAMRFWCGRNTIRLSRINRDNIICHHLQLAELRR